MDKIEDVVDENMTMNFRFGFKLKSGRFVMDLKHVNKAYGNLTILKDAEAQIERGDKIALIGANGKGKSTLLRIIAGTERIDGERKEGHNVNTAFYAQHQLEALQVENEILEELQQAGSSKTERELRGILGCFLFQDEEVFKKIKVLSGGEKSRVALAKTLLSDANFLMMDEPTNHLDFLSVNILVQALQQYEGTYVIVSHDRHFIEQIANKIWYIEDQQIKVYPGTFQEYSYWMAQREEAAAKSERKEVPKKEKPAHSPQKTAPTAPNHNVLERELADMEQAIESKEAEIKAIDEALALPDIYEKAEALKEYSEKRRQAERTLEQLHQKWETVYEQMMEES